MSPSLPAGLGIGLSPDGRQVVVGTQSGALSLLDVPSQRYTTLLRSHTAAVYAVALMGRPGGAPAPAPVQYCTAGADGTVRIWDSGSHQQILELTAPGETVLRWAVRWAGSREGEAVSRPQQRRQLYL